MDRKELIKRYIENHQTTYQSNYKFHSCYQKELRTYKFHYYMRDSQLQQINIFFEVKINGSIQCEFAVPLHEYEQEALLINALKRLEAYIDEKTTLEADEIKQFIDCNESPLNLENQDLINIYNYLKYHMGIVPTTIDTFYSFFIPYIENLLTHKNYLKILQAINLLCNEILYENFWIGINVNYMDQEYYHHLYYFRKLAYLCIPLASHFYASAKEQISDLVVRLFEYERFIFCMITVVEDVTCEDGIKYALFNTLKNKFTLVNEDPEKGNLAYTYMYAIYTQNPKMIQDIIERLFSKIIDDVLSVDNHDMMMALGNYILKTYGYDILIRLFEKQHNSFIFTDFEIADIPIQYHEQIRLDLIDALKYYSVLIDNPIYRLGSLEQIMNINLLLMENFKEETFNEK